MAAAATGEKSLRAKVASSAGWSLGSRLAAQGVQFTLQVLLARLLAPEAFGISTIAIIVSNFASLIADFGIGSKLIRSRIVAKHDVDSAFWTNFLLGAVFCLVLQLVAGPLTGFLQQPAAEGPLRLAALTPLVAIYAVPLALLERDLKMKPVALIESVAALFGASIGIMLALGGFGAYAIVSVTLASVSLSSILFLARARYLPSSVGSRACYASIWSYSRGLVGFNIINFWTRNADNVLLTRFATETQLGLYTRAFALMLLPVSQVQTVLGRVLFPALALLQDDPERLRGAHRRVLLLASCVCAPLSVGAATTSGDLIHVVFGQPWAGMAPMLTLLSIAGVQQIFQGTIGIIYQVTGRTGLMFRWNVAFTLITLCAFVVALPGGAIGICWAVLIRGWVLFPVSMIVPLHLIGERFRDILRLLMPVVCALLLEAAGVLVVMWLLRSASVSPYIRLPLEIAVGGIVFFTSALALVPSFREWIRNAGRRVSRRSVGE